MEPGTYKVLVVDDEEGVREIVCSVLRQRGNICDQASDGQEALEKLSREKYDAAVIDFSMPKMNGIVLMREILKSNPNFPVMIMTGFKDAQFEGQPIDEKAVSDGAIDFLEKPFSIEGFWLRFYKMMENSKIMLQLKARQEDLHKISNVMIGELQRESREKIQVLEKEIEDLKKKLQV